ncbi:hypothetical protein Emag_007747 [Eimeria magna]
MLGVRSQGSLETALVLRERLMAPRAMLVLQFTTTPPVGPIRQGPLPPLSPTTTSAVDALGNLASQGWDIMTTCCEWWTLAAAREYRAARESFEYRLQELQWVDNMSRAVAVGRAVLTRLPQGRSSLAGLVGRMPGAARGPGGDGGPGAIFGRVLIVQRGAASRSHGPGQSIASRVPQRGAPYGAGPAGIGGGYLRIFTSGGASRAERVCTARRAGQPVVNYNRVPRLLKLMIYFIREPLALGV